MPTVCCAGGTPEHPKPCARQAGRLPHKGQGIRERIVVRAPRPHHNARSSELEPAAEVFEDGDGAVEVLARYLLITPREV